MLQRIQTVYMLLAVVFTVACLCMQIGTFSGADQLEVREFNLWLTAQPGGVRQFTVWPLFAVLVLSASVGTCTVFLYRNRRLQARICAFNMLLILGWYILYAVFSQTLVSIVPAPSTLHPSPSTFTTFTPSLAASVPCEATILAVLARRAIIADERLVLAADRIR
ncbi:MAG: DUF4293 domain-containing protein [Prevotella sp.]|nr:DUF4293 domain-containing protein [Prevotella sp.]